MLLAFAESNSISDFILNRVVWLLSQPLFWAILGVLIGPFFFFRGFRVLQEKRLILNVPRSTVRGAAIGLVEVSGRAAGPYTIVSPLTNRECLYYRVVIQPQKQAAAAYSRSLGWDGDFAWLEFLFSLFRQQIKQRTGQIIDEVCAPLFIDDGTGTLMVCPKGSEMDLPRYEGGGGDYLCRVLSRHGFNSSDLGSAVEYCICPGDELFAVGTLTENPWAAPSSNATDRELAPIGPGFVSADTASLLREEAFGYSSPIALQTDTHGFDLHPPTILMGGYPFLISNHSQRDVVTMLGLKSLFFVLLGSAWALWGIWEILGYPQVLRFLGVER